MKLLPEQRICMYCKIVKGIYVTENEFHFVFICPLYDDIRTKYINNSLTVNPTNEKLIRILSSQNMQEIYLLAVYLSKAFKRREENVPDLKI